MKSKMILTLSVLLALVALTGCDSVFIPSNSPITVQSNSLYNDKEESININSVGKIGHGTIQDWSADNNSLLITSTTKAPPLTYNIELLNLSDKALNSFINSDKQQLSAIFEEKGNGVFYVEKATNSDTSQLEWTSPDRATTKTISTANENVQTPLCQAGVNAVLYTNGDNDIIRVSQDGSRIVYHSANGYSISKMTYEADTQTLYFLGRRDSADEYADLYSASLKPDGITNGTLETQLIAKNVVDFSLQSDHSRLAYIMKFDDARKIVVLDLTTRQTRSLAFGDYNALSYTPDGSHLVVTKITNTDEQDFQSIWIVNTQNKEQTQLTSPMIITSPIIIPKDQNTLFFSVQTDDTAVSGSRFYDQVIYQVSFSYNK